MSGVLFHLLLQLMAENKRLMANGRQHMTINEMRFVIIGVGGEAITTEFDILARRLAERLKRRKK